GALPAGLVDPAAGLRRRRRACPGPGRPGGGAAPARLLVEASAAGRPDPRAGRLAGVVGLEGSRSEPCPDEHSVDVSGCAGAADRPRSGGLAEDRPRPPGPLPPAAPVPPLAVG